MEKSIILTREEIATITGRKRFSAQAKQLARMGIECKLNAIGEPIVSRAHFEQIMGGQPTGVCGDDDCMDLNLNFLELKSSDDEKKR